jgi:hypothetical protein
MFTASTVRETTRRTIPEHLVAQVHNPQDSIRGANRAIAVTTK